MIMAFQLCVLLVWCASSLVNGSGLSHSFPVYKDEAGFRLARDYSHTKPAHERAFYWYGNFTVGDTKDVHLLLDVGSPFVVLNPGVYKPSANSKPYSFPNFTEEYEGINKAGTGTINVTGNILLDRVSNGPMTFSHQTVGNITKLSIKGTTHTPTLKGRSGIIGFSGINDTGWMYKDTFSKPSDSWFYNLCRYNVISVCRFAMAFGTNSKGVQVIGKLDKSLYKGELTRAASPTGQDKEVYGAWNTRVDITLNNKIFIKNQTILMDTGTTNIQGTLHATKQIFDKLGYQYVIHSQPGLGDVGTYHFLEAFYPCDKPPTVGFSIPSEHDLKNSKDPNMSKKAKIFNILKSEWPFVDHGNNNCTAVLGGSNVLRVDLPHYKINANAWLVGQAFYQGHYVDHYVSGGKTSLGFADLLNPGNVGGH